VTSGRQRKWVKGGFLWEGGCLEFCWRLRRIVLANVVVGVLCKSVCLWFTARSGVIEVVRDVIDTSDYLFPTEIQDDYCSDDFE
jgi:hypothetical protein